MIEPGASQTDVTSALNHQSDSPFLPGQAMRRRQSLPTIVILLVCTLLTVLLSFRGASLSPSHDPSTALHVRLSTHAATADSAEEATEHEHRHGASEGSHESHQHGHSEGDHSHESVFVAFEYSLTCCQALPQWHLRETKTGQDALATRLERPPKPTTA
jgi:hypothetical protein